MVFFFFFFSSRRRHTRCGRDWSSDVCSSDLGAAARLINHDPAYRYAHAGYLLFDIVKKRPVIPGRAARAARGAEGASPESITPAQGVWIPGSPLRGAPE